MSWFENLHPLWQALLATGFTYAVTAAGAAAVFFVPDKNKGKLSFCMGFACGVMLAASFWSLLSPAIELSTQLGQNAWLTAAAGFLSGCGFLTLCDIWLQSKSKSHTAIRKNALLVSAVTVHNIPEGMSIGVALGCAARGLPGCTTAADLLLALGIGLQNFPEGGCVSLPLHASGLSKAKAFFYGQLSAVVEPIAGVAGAAFAMWVQSALPLCLCFSAGAMVAVACSELVPEAFADSKHRASVGVAVGFAVMMVLDVALG